MNKKTGAIKSLLIPLIHVILTVVALSTANINAYAQCSPQAVLDMQRRGFPQWQIDNICGVFKPIPLPSNGPPAPISLRCLSQAGPCTMMQPAPWEHLVGVKPHLDHHPARFGK
jgi:hypothetical protein